MVSPRRVLGLSVLAIGVGALVAVYAVATSITPEPALPATEMAPSDPTAMRAAATAVARQVQGTMAAQRVDLATRIAVQTPGLAPQALAVAASPPTAGPAASPGPVASPAVVPPDPSLPPTFRFYSGINFGGAPEIIEGRPWLGDAQARAQGLSTPNTAPVNDTDDPLSPPTDPATARMLQSTIYVAGTGRLRIAQSVPNGTYAVYVYLVENYQSSYRSLDVAVEDNAVRANWSAPRGGWEKLGPHVVSVADGSLDVDIVATAGDPTVAGLAIFRDEAAATPSPAAGVPRERSAYAH